ncbi:MAG: hypothetical protein JRJ86_03120 [Deltaproteobacteria bacterium]|nr:hypothetical protein [Deltaproteobacteria bacterium]MBW2118520.1 hypothetical protein [Deltaproteobacteria bacterium]
MVSSKAHLSLPDIENTLHHLNYRWNLEALALWKGDKVPFEAYRIYEGFEDFISLDTLASIQEIEDRVTRTRLEHALIDHYLQRELLPHETEMRTWMRGAAAHVNGQKIYFRDIIPWCQKGSTFDERQVLQKETGPLCKLLKPFPLNYWKIMLDILRKDFGFENYIDYCHAKKGIDYPRYYEILKDILQKTDELYFPVMEKWVRQRFDRPLETLTRFDAINILGLGEFDSLFPEKRIEALTGFFQYWRIDLEKTPGLNLELGREEGKSAQAMCFILQVPEEVYILMKPEGGWVDLETLWHELGHGLSAVFTSPGLSITDRDMTTSFSLSESFAFLLQNLTMSRPFLEDYLGLNPANAETIFYHKVLKDLSVFRRYAAKFLVEYEMFLSGDFSNGEPYAELMASYTGFYYQQESHLFDLVPEFYSLDYVLGWMAEAIMEERLKDILGFKWIFHSETGKILKKWWEKGNRYDIFQFIERNGFGPLGPEVLLRRWQEVLNLGTCVF